MNTKIGKCFFTSNWCNLVIYINWGWESK